MQIGWDGNEPPPPPVLPILASGSDSFRCSAEMDKLLARRSTVFEVARRMPAELKGNNFGTICGSRKY
jgi:hypothetical protein